MFVGFIILSIIFGIANICMIALWIAAAQRYRQLMNLYKQGYYFMEVRYYKRIEFIPIHPRFIDTTTPEPRLMSGYSLVPQPNFFGRYNNPYM